MYAITEKRFSRSPSDMIYLATGNSGSFGLNKVGRSHPPFPYKGVPWIPDSKTLGHLQTEVFWQKSKYLAKQIVSFCVSYYFKISSLFLFSEDTDCRMFIQEEHEFVSLGGFLMVFDNSFESFMDNKNFFPVSFKNSMGFVCRLLERTSFKIIL